MESSEQTKTEEEIAFWRILADQVRRYPRLEVRDLYKLAHQAALGSEHALTDQASVHRWLERELAEMGPGPADPLVDPISADGQIARLHLRPFLAAGGDPGILLTAFVRTAHEFHGSLETLRRYLRYAVKIDLGGDLPFTVEAMLKFFAYMESQGFPAVHHSEQYELAYRPAYRVIQRAYLDGKQGE
jgi:hypothetical protein